MELITDILWSMFVTWFIFWGAIFGSSLFCFIKNKGKLDSKDPEVLLRVVCKAMAFVSVVAGISLYLGFLK